MMNTVRIQDGKVWISDDCDGEAFIPLGQWQAVRGEIDAMIVTAATGREDG